VTFTVRTNSVNIRFAYLPLLAGLAVWTVARARNSVDSLQSLAIAWLPFLALYVFAAATSDTFGPTMLKLGWFAFNFIVAYAWTALFDNRDVVRAYFLSYLAIAAIITIDFVTGFTRGPDHMIGHGQLNGMVPSMTLFRPHAFYYEPSFAASSLALAWALALTRMRDVAPNIATGLVIVGAIALLVMTSRTGWLYATVAGIAILALRFRLQQPLPRGSLTRAAGAAAVGVALLFAVFGFADNRDAFDKLLGKLGFAQTFERVCPRIAQQFPMGFRCLSGEERHQFLGEGQPMNPDDTTEGLRLVWLRTAVATLAEHAWLGVGVGQGSDRFIAPPAVANVWLEVAYETGVPALLAFVFGIGYTLRWGRAFEARHRDILIALALWFLIAWQFIETFPRLDLWIAFWVVLVWTRGDSPAKIRSQHIDGAERRRRSQAVAQVICACLRRLVTLVPREGLRGRRY
jgi:hypothetical protein